MAIQTVANAVEQRKQAEGPGSLIAKYSADFATVLPSHVNAATWVRLAQGALRKGKRAQDGRFELEVAAANDPGKFLAALLEAARLGLEPGSEQYYLTPRKVKGCLEILGITGYQGHIELMYRSGAVTAVNAEVVRANDEYTFDRNSGRPPVHHFPSFARDAERGEMIGIYAYARLTTGDISRVVELNRDDIAKIKASSQGADSEYSPWRAHPKAMWLKSGVRQLQKWVPTSAEFRRELARAAAEAHRVATAPEAPAGADQPHDDFIEGDFAAVDDRPGGEDWPETAEPGGAQ